MERDPSRDRFSATLSELEKSVHVAVEDQTEEQPEPALDPWTGRGDEERHQLRLAGGY